MLSFILYPFAAAILLFVIYQIWTGVILQYSQVYYYKKQGIPFLPNIVPIFGNLPYFQTIQSQMKPGENAIIEAAKVHFGAENVPGVYGFVIFKKPTLIVSDPYVLEELYVNKNKYFDKHPRIYELMKPLIGESILLARSNELWSKKRKSLSTAFYKDKLSLMMDIIRNVVTNYVKFIEKEYVLTKKPFNLASVINELQVKIILNCAFGVDIGDKLIPWRQNGVDTMVKYSYALKTLLNNTPMRSIAIRFFLFPDLVAHYIFPSEKELLQNINNLRNFVKDMILEKKNNIATDAKELDKGDLMTILISDELFKDDIEMIVDECLTFFLAGTQTTSSAVGATIAQTIRNPDIKAKLFNEINSYCQANGVKDLYDVLTLDSLSELSYLQNCFNESMRYEAPLTRSTSMMMTEDIQLPTFKLKAGDIFIIDMYLLHRNKEQWIEPDKYIPDRFDPKSPYYLTPAGKKRNTFSFSPFLGGKRICIGKTFAETSSKFILALFLTKCGKNLRFVDDSNYQTLTRNNALLLQEAVIMVESCQ